MAENEDSSQKTEEPTQRRLEEAAKKGQVPFSREVTSLLMLLSLLLIISTLTPSLSRYGTIKLASYLEYSEDVAFAELVGKILIRGTVDLLLLLAAPLLLFCFVAVASSFVQQGRIIWNQEAITPKLSKISPLAGIKRIFSLNGVVELLKSLMKLVIACLVTYLALAGSVHDLIHLYDHNVNTIVAFILKLASKSLMAVCLFMIVLAGLDYFFQRFRLRQQLRMTKQEIKDELKQTEGNPEIKAKQRSLRLARTKQNLRQVVPKADVIITNPTHYSIALAYDTTKMGAPKVIAKGMDDIAMVIRKLAEEHDIPLVSDPPLARSLYDKVKIDQEILLEHYEAVAKVISHIYKLKGKKVNPIA